MVVKLGRFRKVAWSLQRRFPEGFGLFLRQKTSKIAQISCARTFGVRDNSSCLFEGKSAEYMHSWACVAGGAGFLFLNVLDSLQGTYTVANTYGSVHEISDTVVLHFVQCLIKRNTRVHLPAAPGQYLWCISRCTDQPVVMRVGVWFVVSLSARYKKSARERQAALFNFLFLVYSGSLYAAGRKKTLITREYTNVQGFYINWWVSKNLNNRRSKEFKRRKTQRLFSFFCWYMQINIHT